MAVRIALLTLAATVVLAPAAHAATAQISAREIGIDPRNGPILTPVLEYTAVVGERNRLEVTPEGPGFRLRDTGADIEPGSGCSRVNAREVTCSGATSVTIAAGDEDDTITLSALTTVTSVSAGAGNDVVEGGSALDSINGGGGGDTLRGAGGGDTLEDGDVSGSADADTLDGGEGEDTLLYSARTAGVTVDLPAGTAGELDERDTLVAVENVTGGSGPDVLRGGDGTNRFDGGSGRDLIDTGGGDDRIDCGRGNDICDGNGGDDEVIGTRGRDKLFGGAGNDDVASGGGRADDLLSGGTGRDRIYAGRGKDVLKGGAGPDIIYANDGRRDRVNGGSGSDRAKVDRRLDKVRAVETLR